MKTNLFLSASLVLLCAVSVTPARAAIAPPSGPIIERNIDRAAEAAVDQWMAQLQKAPRTESVQNIGILPLGNDQRNFTTLLVEKLSTDKRFHVVILKGKDWDAIESEMARTDPDGGMGDIFNKATIQWKQMRDTYVIPESTKGADALLLGSVRSVDPDWLRARVRITLHLSRVDTREQIGGGIAEGESMMSWKDLLLYYKVQASLAVAGLVVLLIILGLLGKFSRGMSRPR